MANVYVYGVTATALYILADCQCRILIEFCPRLL